MTTSTTHAPAAVAMAPASPPSLPNLVGTGLIDGWKIVSEYPRAPDPTAAAEKTGGNFSISCVAERQVEGKKAGVFMKEIAFVKVFDLSKAYAITGNMAAAAGLLQTSFSAEVDILDKCLTRGLDRVIKKYTSGDIPVFPGVTMMPSPYIILEHADADLRHVVNNAKYDIAWKLRALHDIAVGLTQIHGHDISHYDLKPSNVLVFEETGEGSKLADFGLSIDHREAGLGAKPAALARAYMPPEFAYGIYPADPIERTRGVDVYHLGSLATFLIAAVIPTEYYLAAIKRELLPFEWQGGAQGQSGYDAALPFLIKTHAEFVAKVSESIPDQFREELTRIITELTHPDHIQRGDPDHRIKVGRPHGVEAYMSKFDRLSRQALSKLAKQP